MKPICCLNGHGLWFSPDCGKYYWQSDGGAGDLFSQDFRTEAGALRSNSHAKLVMQRQSKQATNKDFLNFIDNL